MGILRIHYKIFRMGVCQDNEEDMHDLAHEKKLTYEKEGEKDIVKQIAKQDGKTLSKDPVDWIKCEKGKDMKFEYHPKPRWYKDDEDVECKKCSKKLSAFPDACTTLNGPTAETVVSRPCNKNLLSLRKKKNVKLVVTSNSITTVPLHMIRMACSTAMPANRISLTQSLSGNASALNTNS